METTKIPHDLFPRLPLLDDVKNIIVDTKQDLCDLQQQFSSKEEQLVQKKDNFCLQISRNFDDLKARFNQYLSEQEEKIVKDLILLAEKEANQLTEDRKECDKLQEAISMTESLLNSKDSADNCDDKELDDLRKLASEYTGIVYNLKQRTHIPFDVKFIVNSEFEDMINECNVVSTEIVSSCCAEHVRNSECVTVPTYKFNKHCMEFEGADSGADSDGIIENTAFQETSTTEAHSDDETDDFEISLERASELDHPTGGEPLSPEESLAYSDDDPPPPYPGLPDSMRLFPPTQDDAQLVVVLPPRDGDVSRGHRRSRSADTGRDKRSRNLYPNANAEKKPHQNYEEDVHPELRVPQTSHHSPSAPAMTTSCIPASTHHHVQPHKKTHATGASSHPYSGEHLSPKHLQRLGKQPFGSTESLDRKKHRDRHSSALPPTKTAPFTFKFLSKSNTAVGEDRKSPQLVGMAFLAEAFLVVIDFANRKLKLLKNRIVVGVLSFGRYEPWDVTAVSDSNCAVTVPSAREICFVGHKGFNLKVVKRVSIATGYSCIAYCKQGNVFICGCIVQFGNPHVAIVSMEGDILSIINRNASNHVIFSNPCAIAVTEDFTFAVSDSNKKKVMFFHLDGTKLNSFKGCESNVLEDPRGVASMRYQRLILVSDFKTNCLHVLSNSGVYKGCVVSGGFNSVRLAVNDTQTPQLLIAYENGCVSAYDFAWKRSSRH